MKLIPLNRHLFTMVDDDDFLTLGQMHWVPLRGKKRSTGFNYYAKYYLPNRGGHLLMHRVIMQPRVDQEVDHIDGNGLNNQRANLRLCNRSENGCNRGLQANNKSGHIGVSRQGARQRWCATIKKDGKQMFLGAFDLLEDAITARKRAEMLYHGEFAYKPRSANEHK